MVQKVEIVMESKLDKASFARDKATVQSELKKIEKDSEITLSINVAKLKDDIRKAKATIKAQNLQGAARIEVEAKIERMKGQLRKASRELRNFTDRGNKNLSGMQKIFRGIGTQVKQMGVALAGVFAARAFGKFVADGVRDAIAFEKGLARINTVARVSKDELAGLGKDIKQLSKDLGIAKEELIETGFNISSAGVAFEDVAKILKLSGKVAIGASTDTNTAFEGIIGVIKGYGLEMSEANRVADLFFKTNELGQTTVGDVAGSIGQVATIAKNSKIPLEELFGVYSTLTGVTGDANRVTTQLKAGILALSAPTKIASAKFKELGVEVGAAAIENKGFVQVAKDVFDAVDGDQEKLRQLVPSVEALTLVTALATDQFDVYNDKLNQLENSMGSLNLAVETMEATTAQKVSKITETRNFFRESVGGALISVGFALANFRDKVLEFQAGGEQPFKPVSDGLTELNGKLHEQVVQVKEVRIQQTELSKAYADGAIGVEEYNEATEKLSETEGTLIEQNKETALLRDLEIERLKEVKKAEEEYGIALEELKAKKEAETISNKTYVDELEKLQKSLLDVKNASFDYVEQLNELNKQRVDTSQARLEFAKEKIARIANLRVIEQTIVARLAEAKVIGDTATIQKASAALGVLKFAIITAQGASGNFTKEVTKANKEIEKTPGGAKKAASGLEKYSKEADKLADKISKLTGKEFEYNEALLKNKDTAEEYINDLEDYSDALSDFTDKAGEYYDNLTDKIEGSREAQKGLKEDIEDIDKDIVARLAEIDEALGDKDTSPAEKAELRSERKTAFEGLSEEDKAAIEKQVEELAEFEKLTEIEKLLALKLQKEEALKQEVAREESLIKIREDLANKYEDFLRDKTAIQVGLAKQVEDARKKAAAAQSIVAGGGGGGSAGRATGGGMDAGSPYTVGEYGSELVIPKQASNVIPNKNITSKVEINNNNSIANGFDMDSFKDGLARDIQNAQRGIYN